MRAAGLWVLVWVSSARGLCVLREGGQGCQLREPGRSWGLLRRPDGKALPGGWGACVVGLLGRGGAL